jgi:very-short-patch-repair endonuclease
MWRRARRRHQLLTRDDLVAGGFSPRTFDRWCEQGRLERLHPGVARVPSSPTSVAQQALAAVLALGTADALASHTTAAALWGLECTDEPTQDHTHVIAGRGTRRRLRAVMVHRPEDRLDLRPTVRAGVPTCNPLRVLVDLGAVATPTVVARAHEHFVVAGLVSHAAVVRALGRHARRGRHGCAALRDVVAAWRLGERPPDSALEIAMADLVARFGLPPFVFQPRIAGLTPDFAFPGRVLVEVDGFAHHGGRVAFEEDRRRDVVLAAAGYVVLRFTWLQVVRRPAWVAAQLAAVIAQRTGVPGTDPAIGG